ncbi:hypothetical protein PR048_012417 [Dryococelus australis]|uniref:Uncharacterized protein n=1 Tax=Dryococelus australis TaxID=614101 RepID=A0ABQ9HQP7_9NEOP|nr:hypothetical protein PR048_012417 [Dryococelus australis]
MTARTTRIHLQERGENDNFLSEARGAPYKGEITIVSKFDYSSSRSPIGREDHHSSAGGRTNETTNSETKEKRKNTNMASNECEKLNPKQMTSTNMMSVTPTNMVVETHLPRWGPNAGESLPIWWLQHLPTWWTNERELQLCRLSIWQSGSRVKGQRPTGTGFQDSGRQLHNMTAGRLGRSEPRCPSQTSYNSTPAVRLFTSYQGEPGSIPSRVTPVFSQVVIVPDDAAGRQVFSGISRFSRPCIPALLHSHLISPASALKTSLIRAAQSWPINRTRSKIAQHCATAVSVDVVTAEVIAKVVEEGVRSSLRRLDVTYATRESTKSCLFIQSTPETRKTSANYNTPEDIFHEDNEDEEEAADEESVSINSPVVTARTGRKRVRNVDGNVMEQSGFH